MTGVSSAISATETVNDTVLGVSITIMQSEMNEKEVYIYVLLVSNG